MVSSAFGPDFMAGFFRDKLALGLGPLDGIAPDSVLEFRCRYAGCPRFGQVELEMTINYLFPSGDNVTCPLVDTAFRLIPQRLARHLCLRSTRIGATLLQGPAVSLNCAGHEC
jgi:hypothetical protein